MITLTRYLKQHARKQEAVYHGLRDALESGALARGEKLPSSRALASQLGIARGTVVLAYEMLESDGLIGFEPGRRALVKEKVDARPRTAVVPFRLSSWARRLPAAREEVLEPGRIDFNAGHTDRNLFPERDWRSALHRSMRSFDPAKAAPIAGVEALRAAVASHAVRRRGMRVHPEQVVIVNGSIQAIAILAHLLLDTGETAVLENPGYTGIRDSILLAGARPHFAPVDSGGIEPADWKARMCFVTPAGQFPTGAVLSNDRRAELVRWAEKRRAVIVEDDYDSEFRRRGRPREPLQCLAPLHVVHIGTFSRTLAAGLRLGYAILPPNLVEPFIRAKRTFETHPAGALEQTALSWLMRSGAYERHLRRAGRHYARRHDLLQSLVRTQCRGALEIADSETGLHAFAWWKKSARLLAVFEARCREAGIIPGSTRRHYFQRYSPSMLFSVAHLSESKLEEGLRTMGRILRNLL